MLALIFLVPNVIAAGRKVTVYSVEHAYVDCQLNHCSLGLSSEDKELNRAVVMTAQMKVCCECVVYARMYSRDPKTKVPPAYTPIDISYDEYRGTLESISQVIRDRYFYAQPSSMKEKKVGCFPKAKNVVGKFLEIFKVNHLDLVCVVKMH
ncbi:unnamed protein product [Cylicocyclus nassatus]|uniref:Uncharacterized protein n=1 Tax=Cylicocyclus nassatus TaxID=53992 RepID=A0AA36GCH1_CYLNA|nr:unnamed protein product [Cylicocyclus nassatus]